MNTSKQPLISIVTVVLDGAQTLGKALQSVFTQSFTDYEYIVIDGGSTDGSVKILQKYDKYISYWQSEPDKGVYDAMNKALQYVKGQWVYFLGADDYLICDLREVAKYLKDSRTIYYGDVYRPAVNRMYDGNFTAYKLASRNICHQSVFYPKEIWDRYTYNLKYPVLADYELNMRCYSDPEVSLQYLPITVAVFKDEGGLSPLQADSAFELDRMRLIRENFPNIVYWLAAVRFAFLRILNKIGVIVIVVNIYHFFLRLLSRSSESTPKLH